MSKNVSLTVRIPEDLMEALEDYHWVARTQVRDIVVQAIADRVGWSPDATE